MRCEVCHQPTPVIAGMRRRFCCRRCSTLARWPALLVPPDYQPRHSLHDGPEVLPVMVWPAPAAPSAAVAVRRLCIDCGATLPEPTVRGRPPVRCADCRAGKSVLPWQRPPFIPAGPEVDLPWLTEELKPPAMGWEDGAG